MRRACWSHMYRTKSKLPSPNYSTLVGTVTGRWFIIYFQGGGCGAVAEIQVFEQCER